MISCLHFLEHSSNAFPVYPGGQVQVGMWLKTRHLALVPQVPEQGSTHLFPAHAALLEQSELRMHSGRQPLYGSPKRPGGQVQTQRVPPRDDLAVALGPHGLGLQASGFGVTGRSSSN